MTQRKAHPKIHNEEKRTSSSTGLKFDKRREDFELPAGNRRIAELVYRLTTEGQAPRDQAVAIGIGVFVGCIPIFGTHVFMVLVIASLARLSRVRMYAATWISNPIFAPVLVWAELQVGHIILTGQIMDHSMARVSELGVAGLGWALFAGTMVLGTTLGILAALMVWVWIPRGTDVIRRRRVIEAASYRYLDLGLRQWFRIRQALYLNRALADLVIGGKLDSSDRIVDLGCGLGELLALVLETSVTSRKRSFVGVTSKHQFAARARQVLPADVEVKVADPAGWNFGAADSILVWQAQHRDAPDIDDDLIRRARGSLNPNGIFVLSWSTKRLFDHGNAAFDRALQRLEAGGFSIENRSSSTGWYRLWNVIVARA